MVHHEEYGSVLVLRLDHGKVAALDLELLADLDAALADAEHAPARAFVLTGTGSSFSAGVDLYRVLDGGPEYVRRFLPLLDRVLRRLFLLPRPVVAAVNGHAIAGGCILAGACDRRLVAAGRARLGVPELRVGVPFPVLAFEIVRFAVAPQHLPEVVYGGATWGPEEALQRGLVDEVVAAPELLERALATAESYAAIPPVAFALAKRQMRAPALERVEKLEREMGQSVVDAWCDPAMPAILRAYLDSTLGPRS